MSTVAFVGLGIMGLPMAVNLQRSGFAVTGVVRPGKDAPRAREAGVGVTDRAAEAVAAADFVVTMLPDSPDVAAAVESAVPHLREGALMVDMSTIDPVVTRRLRSDVVPPGVGMLDAPVSGGEAGAIEGTLSVMVGGEAEDFDRARPLFEAVGTTIVHVGPISAGQVVKAANQLIVAGNIQVLAEALVFLEAQGADVEAAFDVLAGGLAGSTVLTRKRSALLERSFAPGFRLALHGKDLGIVQAAATEAGVSLPVTALVTQFVRSLNARGDGALDHSALLKLVDDLNRRK